MTSTNLTSRTVGELGAHLPHGTHDAASGEWDTAIGCRVWNLAAERELGRLLAKVKVPARRVTLTLARMCSQLGALHFDDGRSEKEINLLAAAIGGMLAADVSYAYVRLRVETLGTAVDISTSCPHCEHQATMRVDIGDMDVRCVDDRSKLSTEVTLASPIKHKDEVITAVTVTPLRWRAIEAAAKNGDDPTSAMVLAGVVGKNGSPWVPGAADLDEMRRRDIDLLFHAMDEISPGPTWQVEIDCGRCHRDSTQVIDWLSPGFFRASSR